MKYKEKKIDRNKNENKMKILRTKSKNTKERRR